MKWIFDRTVSFIGLVLLLPLLIVIAAVIKCSEPRLPVFFVQKRVGQHGKLFNLYKFRSMRPETAGTTVTVSGDRRITPVGCFLRKYKLDELPELWNIFIGDMSFVGPRPDVPGYADRLVGEEREILALKPGLTGPATLKYRNEEELLSVQSDPVTYNDTVLWPDKVKINLDYLKNRNFVMDLRLIFKTLLSLK